MVMIIIFTKVSDYCRTLALQSCQAEGAIQDLFFSVAKDLGLGSGEGQGAADEFVAAVVAAKSAAGEVLGLEGAAVVAAELEFELEVVAAAAVGADAAVVVAAAVVDAAAVVAAVGGAAAVVGSVPSGGGVPRSCPRV